MAAMIDESATLTPDATVDDEDDEGGDDDDDDVL